MGEKLSCLQAIRILGAAVRAVKRSQGAHDREDRSFRLRQRACSAVALERRVAHLDGGLIFSFLESADSQFSSDRSELHCSDSGRTGA